VGSGFAGLGMGIRLKQRGRDSFVILEKSSAIGGTWRDNRYPGCACDVPSHLYSFSFEQNPGWTRLFAPREEIHAYLERCADKYRLRTHLRLETEVLRVEYDERGAFWRVWTSHGASLTCRYLVLGIGGLSKPSYPALPGIARFRGQAFHSANWDPDCDLTGRRVAVVGTGASAIQLVPRLADSAAELRLFQRTPPWVLPKPDRAIGAREQRLFALFPVLQRLYRYWIYWLFELRCVGFTVNPKLMRAVAHLGRRHIRRQVASPALRRAVTPEYMPGCKRILMANDYYPALCRDHVSLISEPIVEVTERGLLTADGVEHQVDTIVYGTGFRVADFLTPLSVIGRGGLDLNAAWKAGSEAYLGTLIADFPNLFMLCGPNTGLGHSSMIFMIEAQIELALRCVSALERRDAQAVQISAEAQREFNRTLRPRLQRSVWASGCQSWYLHRNGENRTLWPGFTFEFWLRARHLRESLLQFEDVSVERAIAASAAEHACERGAC
jgi:cation diffusion facilitator CzcD-associated flavoprotein CzcO